MNVKFKNDYRNLILKQYQFNYPLYEAIFLLYLECFFEKDYEAKNLNFTYVILVKKFPYSRNPAKRISKLIQTHFTPASIRLLNKR